MTTVPPRPCVVCGKPAVWIVSRPNASGPAFCNKRACAEKLIGDDTPITRLVPGDDSNMVTVEEIPIPAMLQVMLDALCEQEREEQWSPHELAERAFRMGRANPHRLVSEAARPSGEVLLLREQLATAMSCIEGLQKHLGSAEAPKDAGLALLKEARRRIRAIEIKDEHAYALGVAIGQLYVMSDELRRERGPLGEGMDPPSACDFVSVSGAACGLLANHTGMHDARRAAEASNRTIEAFLDAYNAGKQNEDPNEAFDRWSGRGVAAP